MKPDERPRKNAGSTDVDAQPASPKHSTLAERNGVEAEPTEAFPIAAIERLVHTFYGHVQDDPKLGPFFDARIDDWPVHLDRMVNFWRSVLRSDPTFKPSEKGSPPMIHRAFEGLELDHFSRWLALFQATATECFDELPAAHVIDCSRRIGSVLSRHLGGPIPDGTLPIATPES